MNFDDLIPGNDKKPDPASFGMFADLVPEQQGDFMRGAKVALGQTMPIAKGVVGLAGATAESALGEDSMLGKFAGKVKDWGLQGYQSGMDKLQPLQRDTDELTTAWDKAKEGDLGALLDWAQYGLGYAVGQGGEAMLTSLIGGAAGAALGGGAATPVTGPAGAITGLIAKGAVKEAAQGLIQKAVIKEANAIVAASAGKMTAEEAVKVATRNVAKEIGSTSALLAYGTGQELGSIYPDAEAQAAKEGRKLDGMDLARVWGAGLVAGGIEGLTDKLGIDVAMGKLKVPGASTRVGQAALTGVAGAATEGATEAAQTVVERFGAGQPIADDEGLKDIINSAGLGAIGGGGIGGGAGLLHGGKVGDPKDIARSNQAMDDIATAPNADAAIDAANRTYIPVKMPETFDAEGAMARMERMRANDENMLKDKQDLTPAVTKGPAITAPQVQGETPAAVVDAALNGTQPTPEPETVTAPNPVEAARTAAQGQPSTAPARVPVELPQETFQERLAVVREKVEDSRTRQQVRDLLGPEQLHDLLYMASAADNDKLPGRTSDAMLAHAERLLNDAGVPALPRQQKAADQARQKAETLAQKQAKIDAAATPKPATEEGQKSTEASVAPGPSVIDERAAQTAESPTNDRVVSNAQKEAGNYLKGHDATTFPGLDLSIENDAGSTRYDTKHEPPQWETKISHHYGYIKGTKSIDGEHMDVFVKPGTPEGHTGPVFIVDQVDPKTGKDDEHKVMLGFDSMKEAQDAYHANYPTDWKGMGAITETPFEDFKAWLASGRTHLPFRPRTLRERVEQAKARQNSAESTPTSAAPAESPQSEQVITVGTPEAAPTAQQRAEEAESRDATLVDLRKRESVLQALEKCVGTSTLMGCVAKAGSALQAVDKNAIMARARALRASGSTTAQAATQAVREQLETVRAAIEGHRATIKPAPAPAPEPAPAPREEPAAAPAEPELPDLGPTVKHTTAKGKEIFGYVVRGVSDPELRAIDPYAFKKDGGIFVRERHHDELQQFLHSKGLTNATQQVDEPSSVQPERSGGDEGGQAAEASGGDRVQRPTEGERKPDGASAAQPEAPQEEIAPAPSLAERAQAKKEAAPEKGTLTGHLEAAIRADGMPKDNPALKKLVAEFDGADPSPARMKEAQEALEAAIVRVARGIARFPGVRVRDQFDKLLALYQSQPNLNVRTSTSISNQAYSTPAPLAFLADKLARVTNDTTLYEPTAGTGMLTILAKPENVVVNELNPERVAILKTLGFKRVDAGNAIDPHVEPKSIDRVVANPPFGPIKDAKGESVKVKYDGYTIGQIDHQIALHALEGMKDDGAATLILGANQSPGGLSNQDLIFFNYLYSHYNVTCHFEVDGALYTRQGASWPVRVITIEGRQASDRISPQPGVIGRATTWDEVYERYEQGLAAGRAGRGVPTGVVSSTAAGPDVTQPVREPAGGQAAADDRRGPAPSDAGNANVGGERTEPVVDSGGKPAEPVGQRDRGERPSAGADLADQVGGNAGRTGAREPDRNSGAARLDNPLQPADNEFQVAYTPQSSRKDTGVLIPVNMRSPTEQAMRRLEDEVGDIDDFAARKLGYSSVAQMHEGLMGLQVDSVASAIAQIEKGNGTIIADQTGIGKGRQAAAIIRYAIRQGRIPVFVSVKPSLFTDMYGDLHDIGSDDVQPLILNVTESIKGENDEKLFANKPGQHKRTLEQVAQSGMLPEGRNALFMTYSQINVDNLQRKAVAALAPRAIFVLDESHNAGGDSATGDFIKGVLDQSKGVVYLSATYAKRPDNMPVYFKTDIGKAIGDGESLQNAMAMGGLPLQTVVANNLVKAGQMFRRERSYDGVDIKTVIDTDNRAQHEKTSDAATEALRGIVAADRMFHEVYFKEVQKQAGAEAKRAEAAGNAASASVNHTEFSSVVHNFVKQMLLGLEADNAAERAIGMLQNGIKPLIALENTMGSFLAEYAQASKLKPGDALGNFGYRNVLSRALERTRYITIQQPNGDKVKEYISLSQLDPLTRQAYKRAQDIIDDLEIDLPVSPIDWMRMRLEKAGFSVAEVTGRQDLRIDYTDGEQKLAQMDVLEKKDKVRTTRMFNSGKLDAIILNVAGSTGISLHASEKFSDQRRRKMIVAQAAGDINVFMQMLGRIHRTGQVTLPAYELLNADLPAVKRPTAVLAKKMKSLNANTSSNTESATSVKALDMLNKYGDSVVEQYLEDNPQLARDLGLGTDSAGTDDEGTGREDIARKMTGRLALMSVQRQREVYADLEENYSTLIDYLNKTNQNDLEPRTFDFDARELNSDVIFEGQDPTTPFGEDAIYNEYSIKAQGKPMTPAEVQAAMTEHLAGARNGTVHANSMIAKLDSGFDAYRNRLNDEQQVQANNARAAAIDFIRDHAIGEAFRVDINGETYIAVVTNIRSTHKESGNPFAMSKIQVSVALNGALRGVTVPATRFTGIETSKVRRNDFDLHRMFREGPKDERQVAKVITGNLLGAYSELKGVKGSIISFTKADGSVEQGILLPKSFDMAKNTQGDHRFTSGEEAATFLRLSQAENIGKFGIQTRDGIVRVTPEGGGAIRIAVPKSKAKGGKFFLDDALRGAVGDFVSVGDRMVADVGPTDAAAALDILMRKQALYTLPSMAAEARDIRASTQPQSKKGTSFSNPDANVGLVDTRARPMQRADTAANWLAQNGAEPWVREVAAKIAPFIDDQTPIKYLRIGERIEVGPNGVTRSAADLFRRNAGIFGVNEVDPISGRGAIYLKTGDKAPIDQGRLLHELVHAATQRALGITKSAIVRAEIESIRAVLQRTFNQVISSPQASEQARNDAAFFAQVIDDEHEFLAYGLTSPTFRQWAQSLDENGRIIKTPTLDQGAKPKLTLWQKFVDAVRSLVGLSKLYQQRLDDLLSQRERELAQFVTANTPPTLVKRIDALLQRTLDLRVGAQEFADNWVPGRDAKRAGKTAAEAPTGVNPFLARLRAGPVPVPAEGFSIEDKRGFKPLYDAGYAVVEKRGDQQVLRLGKGNWYEDATPEQQKVLDGLERISDFHDLSFRAATEDVHEAADAAFFDSEVAPGVREVSIESIGPLLEGYDTKQEQARIDALAAAIKENGEITPIFVGIDQTGEAFIMEGQHRVRALQQLGYKTVPAKVVVDMGNPDDGPTPLMKAGRSEVMTTLRSLDQKKVRNLFVDAVTSHSSTNLWERTIGTQYAKAQKHPLFARVWNAVQDYMRDTSLFANHAADQAPDILPRLETMRDLFKDGLTQHGAKREDIDAAGRAIFEGTLKWSRDENGELVDNDEAIARADELTTDQKARVLFKAGLVSEAELKRWQATPLDIYDGAVNNRYEQRLLRPGVVFSDAELQSMFKLNKHQINLYREFRSAIDTSLDDLGKSELVRLAGTTGRAVARQALDSADVAEAAGILSAEIDRLTEGQSTAEARDRLTELRNTINDKANQIARLKREGYAPLMRFGDRTVTVRDADGNVEFFSMFENDLQANRAVRNLRDEFPRSEITQGRMSKEGYKLFQGLDLNALEVFADQTGHADNEVYQDFLRLAKSSRSALKRMIHRKGIAGFSENTSRVLASFVTSNARMAAGNLHMGEAMKAAADIPNEMGDLKDEATKLIRYVQEPGEEAAGARALLFTNFIGGSAASALVNLTQPFTMSLPYLSQFGGLANAGRHLLAATKAAAGGKIDAELTKIMHDNSDVVSPQEIHHLTTEAMDRFGNHPVLKKAAFLWGSMFSLSEQFNRRVTFIAALQTAREQGMVDPVEFARKAVIETQGLYNKGNKPNWARGAIGATLMTFKQFSIHYLEFLTRMWKSGPEGKKAVAAALAIMVLTAGAGGLPFADDLDDLIDTLAQALGYNFSSKKAKRKFIAETLGDTAADFMTRGITGVAGMPIDVSLRMGMGNLIPGTGALLRSNTDRSRDVLEFGGAAGSLAKSAMDASSAALSGDFGKAMLGGAPLAIQNIAKAAEMFNTGEYRNQKGQKVMNTTLGDVAAKFIGFQPGDVARESANQQIVQRSIQLAKNVESEIAAKWAQGLNDNRPELAAEARAELADWNAKNPETPMRISMQQVIQRVRDMRMTRGERTTKAAPRELRQGVREDLSQ